MILGDFNAMPVSRNTRDMPPALCTRSPSPSSPSFVQHLATRLRRQIREQRREQQNLKRQQETSSPSPASASSQVTSSFSIMTMPQHILTFICMIAIISGAVPLFTLTSASAVPSASIPSLPADVTSNRRNNVNKGSMNSGNSDLSSRKSQFAYQHQMLPRCPLQCSCDSVSGRKRVSCLTGGMTSIPTSQMDRETNILLFSGKADQPNEAAIGRIFMDLPHLQEISITYSSLPMIGESTFWPGKELEFLDLSSNQIDRLKDSDFNPLTNLKSLNLSDNRLADIPSASFRLLTNLTSISLSRNQISKLVPRMFYKLDRLEVLDLSENPLSGTEVTASIFQDVHSLKVLKIERSGLKLISHLTWNELPSLRELHLSENNLSFLGSYEYSSLSSLKSLHLDGNRISIIRDNAFFGLRLTHLGISRNLLTSLPICAFCNLNVESLDLSSNRFTSFQTGLLRPLSLSLIALNAGSNSHLSHPSQSISNLLSPLRSAQIIKISWNHLNDTLPDGTFDNLTQLHTLDLSQNQLSNISAAWFAHLDNLESLDLSYNLIHGLDPEVLMVMQAKHTMKSLHLQNNPWICKRCRILPLMDWIHHHSPPAYFNTCLREGNPDSGTDPQSSMKVISSTSATAFGCVVCSQPDHLSGRALHSLTEADLEYCPDPRIHMRLTASEPRLGLIMAVIIICSTCVLVIVIAIVYKFKLAAVYYTHEEDGFTGYEFTQPKMTSLATSPNHHHLNYPPPHLHHQHPHRHHVSGHSSMSNFNHQRSRQHHHSHNPLRLSRSLCFNSIRIGRGKKNSHHKQVFGFMQAPASSSSTTPTSSSNTHTSFHRSSSSPMFPSMSHSNSFTRKFTNYKSPFKSPFKCSRAKSTSSNHSTSPLSQSSSSSYDEAPAQLTTTTMTNIVRPKVRF